MMRLSGCSAAPRSQIRLRSKGSRSLMHGSFRTFFIFVLPNARQVGKRRNTRTNNESLICTFRVDSASVLTMFVDFNNAANANDSLQCCCCCCWPCCLPHFRRDGSEQQMRSQNSFHFLCKTKTTCRALEFVWLPTSCCCCCCCDHADDGIISSLESYPLY